MSHRWLPYFLGVALACSSNPALAVDCANALDQATMGMCAAQAYEQANVELNSLYKQALQRLKDDDGQMKRMVAAERAWIGFRDAECKFVSGPSIGGSANGMELSNCLASLTQKRSADLKTYLACQEDDCPLPPE